ncbi:MAG: CARDB domain-containing protein [Thermoplasmatota archaeon]
MSSDGGKTWERLTPEATAGQPLGYNSSVLNAASVLSATHDPLVPTYAFTGNSSLVPGNDNGFYLTTIDLGKVPSLLAKDSPFASFPVQREGNGDPHYEPQTGGGRTFYPDFRAAYGASADNTTLLPDYVTDPSWFGGTSGIDKGGFWQEDVLTHQQPDPKSSTPTRQFFWSGSPALADDNLRAWNSELDLKVNLSVIPLDRHVEADWWEWHPMDASEHILVLPAGSGTPPARAAPDGASVETQITDSSTAVDSARINVTNATRVLDHQGHWFHFVTDLTSRLDLLARDPARVAEQRLLTNVSFVFSPVQGNLTLTPNSYETRWPGDLGWVVDDFNVASFTLDHGRKVYDRAPVLAWSRILDDARVNGTNGTGLVHAFRCVVPQDQSGNPCQYSWNISRDIDTNWSAPRGLGLTWALANASDLVGLPSATNFSFDGWHTLDLNDQNLFPTAALVDHTGAVVLPDGSDSKVWYNGYLDPKNVDPTIGLQPSRDERLVTPTLDLSRVSGSSARISFWQLYAFHTTPLGSKDWRVPGEFAEGGAAEVQVYDPDRNVWGPWEQLYPNAANLSLAAKGGYTNKTVLEDDSLADASTGYYFDTPFAVQPDAKNSTAYAYLWSGLSSERPGAVNGWVQDSLDLSPYIGKLVRVGFHSFTDRHNAGDRHIQPVTPGMLVPGGWYLDDITVTGDLLLGKPVQFRFRAGTDGSENHGYWALDDLAVTGNSYRRNLGVFVGQAAAGGAPGSTVLVNATLRNLGDLVRRNIALEIRETTPLAGADGLAFGGSPRVGTLVVGNDAEHPEASVQGIDLPPRASTPVQFAITIPTSAAADRTPRTYELRVLEKNDFTGTYQPITDNEIPGFLSTSRLLRVETRAHVSFGVPVLSPSSVAPGTTTTLTVPVSNDGVMDVVLLNVSCVAERSGGFPAVHHDAGDVDVETLGAPQACTPLHVPARIGPGRAENATWTFTPGSAGIYRIVANMVANNSISDNVTPATPLVARLWAGVKPVFAREDFESKTNDSKWPTGFAVQSSQGASTNPSQPGSAITVPGTDWQTQTEHAASGTTAFEAGVKDVDFANGKSYATLGGSATQGPAFTLRSPPIDLHNASGGAAYLRFQQLVQLARGDGADVRVQVLRDETQPGLDSSWGNACKLFPSVANYTSPVLSLWTPATGSNTTMDNNGDLVEQTGNQKMVSGPSELIVSNDPRFIDVIFPQVPTHPVDHRADLAAKVYYGGFSTAWTRGEFDLSHVQCWNEPLVGRTVRFQFTLWSGVADSASADWLKRGVGHGWFLDDLSVTSFNASFSPVVQKFDLLDNATKQFPFELVNTAPQDDAYTLSLVADSTSAPAGSITPPADPTHVVAGATATPMLDVQLPRAPELLPAIYNAKVRLTSLADPNLVRDAMITFDFAPRRWADLKVTVDPPAHPLEAGVQTLLPIVVTNNGLVTAPATTLKVTDTWTAPDGSVKVTDVKCLFNETCATSGPLPSLLENPDESTTIVVLPWTPDANQRGHHVLRIEVDPDHLIEEYTRLDDVVSLSFDVGALHEPDLALNDSGVSIVNALGATLRSVSDGDLTRYDVEQGDLVTLSVVVKNIGNDVATNVDVRAFIGPLSLPPKILQVLPAGSESVVTFTWVAQKGEWPLAFVAHTAQVELDDSNNRVPSGGAIVLAVKGFDVGATLTGIPAKVAPGDKFDATLTLENTGTGGEDLVLSPVVPADWGVTFDAAGVFLAKGRSGVNAFSAPVHFTVGPHALAGAAPLGVRVASRDNPTKQTTAVGSSVVKSVYGATLAAPEFSTAPGLVALPVTLTNLGNNADVMLVDATLPAGWAVNGTLPLAVAVAPFSVDRTSLPIVTPTGLPVGTYNVPVTLTLADGSKATTISHVTILANRVVSFLAGSATPVPGADKLVYAVTATNVGNARAVFSILLSGVPSGWIADVSPSGGDLAPGESIPLALTVTPAANVTGGSYRLTLTAHFADTQAGAARASASSGVIEVKILKPDVAVHDFGISPRLDLKSGTRLSAKVPVENVGTSPATDVHIDLFVDDVFISEVRLASLAPGEKREVTLNWTALGGGHTLTVVADPFHSALDADRDNNAVSKLVTVAGAQEKVTGLPAASRVPAPEGGIQIVFMALAAIALLGARRGRVRRRG